ncbi:hypothetical protein N0V93_008979 [Gnomoniopsis smithogilvyi]|uniref:Uncharacterized protein n=1 Tax=Gnomoniopsis smithogilvyi TaxID=1191159 RepID=A0A9W8YJ38_9PEZI|nr:hypothetical protein N0V93_008979 [Gnomoniopsis smithogilvyi]
MQFTTIFALAAAVVGVTANVHSKCHCVDANNVLDEATTVKSCTFYPRDELYNSNEKLADPATIVLDIDADGLCESKDAATGEVAAHLGGDQFETACTRNAPDNVKVFSVCN